jgi:DNA-binding HxlR family transcriptional regulator
MKKQPRRSDCPINFALEIFGDKWTLLIIRDLMFKGKHYYGEFLQSEEKMATNILADRLSLLEQSGIITKTVDEQHKSKQVYKLTPKGIDLLPTLTEIILWSAKHDHKTAADETFIERAQTDRETLFNEVTAYLV